MTQPSPKLAALHLAAERATAELSDVDINRRCELLGIAVPTSGSPLQIEMLGTTKQLHPKTFEGSTLNPKGPLHPIDRLLLLCYLSQKSPIVPTGDWITFRELGGGNFYYPEFSRRVTKPLTEEIKDNLGVLGDRLDQFRWNALPHGDLGAKIHVLGTIELALIYNLSEPEMHLPAEAQILFDRSIKHRFTAEQALGLAGRLCRGLRREPCASCQACLLCD